MSGPASCQHSRASGRPQGACPRPQVSGKRRYRTGVHHAAPYRRGILASEYQVRALSGASSAVDEPLSKAPEELGAVSHQGCSRIESLIFPSSGTSRHGERSAFPAYCRRFFNVTSGWFRPTHTGASGRDCRQSGGSLPHLLDGGKLTVYRFIMARVIFSPAMNATGAGSSATACGLLIPAIGTRLMILFVRER